MFLYSQEAVEERVEVSAQRTHLKEGVVVVVEGSRTVGSQPQL